MAGSLDHIVGDDGRFRMDLIENLGDAHEALEECFHIIRHLTGGDPGPVCQELDYGVPADEDEQPVLMRAAKGAKAR